MPSSIFVNLPVTDLARSRAFYEGLGFGVNEQFSDANAACIVLSETIYAMLLVTPYFQTFTPRAIVDAHAAIEVLLALALEDREAVDAMLAAALAGGGSEPRPVQDLGFMYSRAFSDPDGHTWEPFYMEAPPAA